MTQINIKKIMMYDKANGKLIDSIELDSWMKPDVIIIGGLELTNQSGDEWIDDAGNMWLGGATDDDGTYELFPAHNDGDPVNA